MTIKTYSTTITVDVEIVESVRYPGWSLVYARHGKNKTFNVAFVKNERAKKINSYKTANIKSDEIVPPHVPPHLGAYKATAMILPISWLESGANMKDYPSENVSKLEWGSDVPEDQELVYFCFGDYSILKEDGDTLYNVPVKNFYLDRDYDLRQMIKDGAPEGITFLDHGGYGRKIYYVPGNGDTLDVEFRLSDKMYRKYKMAGSFYEREQFLRKNTFLKKYVRKEKLVDATWDDED